MHDRWTVPVFVTAFCALTMSGEASGALAQAPAARRPAVEQSVPPPPGGAVTPRTEQGAEQTRDELRRLFEQYPPSLRLVLSHDPTLLTNADYLATYPELAAFLAQHPEVARNPAFFVGRSDQWENDPQARLARMWEKSFEGAAILLVFITVTCAVVWLLKTLIDHFRWNRLARAHADLQSRLLDRFAASQELLTYLETPAGRRLFELAPIPVDTAQRAPIGRILLSVQIGLVLGFAGLALQFVSTRVVEVGQPLFVFGVMALALGVGFITSAVVAYVLSKRLGLLEQRTAHGDA